MKIRVVDSDPIVGFVDYGFFDDKKNLGYSSKYSDGANQACLLTQ